MYFSLLIAVAIARDGWISFEFGPRVGRGFYLLSRR